MKSTLNSIFWTPLFNIWRGLQWL